MRRILRLILFVALFLPVQAALFGQERNCPDWDALLDRYERICNMTLELKAERSRGAGIADSRLEPLLGELSALRNELKAAGDRMPAGARRRYEAIRRMYASGQITDTRPFWPSPVSPEPVAVPPAVRPESFIGVPDHPRVPVRAVPCSRWGIYAVAAVFPEFSGGLRAEYLGSRWGGYVSALSNFNFHKIAYQAGSDGRTADGFIWTSGRSAVDRFFVTAGPVLRVADRFSVCGGLGYGMRRLCWEDGQGEWMEVADVSRKGLCAELGAGVRLGKLLVSVGCITLPFTYNAVTLSLGFSL